jgi:UDP-N-acetylglucosamine 2-epimerase
VNIGTRQQGRLRGENVIDVTYDAAAIREAVIRCVDDEAFRSTCRSIVNPYGAGDAGRRIADVLATIPLDARLVQKKMMY